MRSVVLITKDNFFSLLPKMLRNVNNEFLLLLYFDNNMGSNMNLLNELKKYFYNTPQDSYFKNVVIISQYDFLANDLLVEAVIKPKDFYNFNLNGFVHKYEHESEESVKDFIINNRNIFSYSFDIFEEKDPWFYQYKKNRIMILSEETYDRIINNYHKIKVAYPDIIINIFRNNDNSRLVKFLKLTGGEAQIIITFVNNILIEYTKWSDLYIFTESDNLYKVAISFIKDYLDIVEYPHSITFLQNFFQVENKEVTEDKYYDLDEIIEKKCVKYYKLIENSGDSLKKEVVIEQGKLIVNLGLAKKIIIKKIYNNLN